MRRWSPVIVRGSEGMVAHVFIPQPALITDGTDNVAAYTCDALGRRLLRAQQHHQHICSYGTFFGLTSRLCALSGKNVEFMLTPVVSLIFQSSCRPGQPFLRSFSEGGRPPFFSSLCVL